MSTAALCILIAIFGVAGAAWPRRQRSAGTTAPSPAQRLAQWEIRLGQHRAEQRLIAEARAQAFDARAIVRPKINPKLPKDRRRFTLVPRRSPTDGSAAPFALSAQGGQLTPRTARGSGNAA